MVRLPEVAVEELFMLLVSTDKPACCALTPPAPITEQSRSAAATAEPPTDRGLAHDDTRMRLICFNTPESCKVCFDLNTKKHTV